MVGIQPSALRRGPGKGRDTAERFYQNRVDRPEYMVFVGLAGVVSQGQEQLDQVHFDLLGTNAGGVGTVHPIERRETVKFEKLVKVALDELRMEMLGVQVLFGFQMQGVFQDGFDQTPWPPAGPTQRPCPWSF